jgi:hypothetical protein
LILLRRAVMQSSLIGKIEKAKRYAQETDRVTFSEFSVKFRGEHDTYITSLKEGTWHCSCDFFATWKTCSHTMAMERIVGGMLPHEAVTAHGAPALT